MEIPIKLNITPYEYQKEGIIKGLELKRLFLGDEPGLGKTCQSIGIVNTAGAYPSLVICPSSLKINWKREFEKFAGVEALILNDSVKSTWGYLLQMRTADVCICNYESLRKFFVWKYRKGDRLKDIVFNPFISLFKSVIIDESHRCKDPGAQQSKFIAGIAHGKKYIMELTGTPVSEPTA